MEKSIVLHRHVILRIGLLGAFFVLDRILKGIARSMLVSGQIVAWDSWFGWVGLVPSVNHVLAFSLPVPNGFIWPLGIVVLVGLLVLMWRSVGVQRTALASIFLGAVSNLGDRIAFGGVTDYVAVTSAFPAFNIADLFVLFGVTVLLWCQHARNERTP